MSTTTNDQASAPATASAPALPPVGYASEHRPYEPQGYEGLKFEVLNWPAKSEWETLTGGNKQLADYLDYAAMEHTRVRDFKKARDGRKALSLDVRTCKSPHWGKEEKKGKNLSPEEQLAAMSPEEQKAKLAELIAKFGGA